MVLENDRFYLDKKEPTKGCLLALRHVLLRQDEAITETVKWGMPCFCFQQKMFCFLWTDKKTGAPYLLFVEGKKLDHPLLEEGNRSRMKSLRVDPEKDLPIDLIESLLEKALDLYRQKGE